MISWMRAGFSSITAERWDRLIGAAVPRHRVLLEQIQADLQVAGVWTTARSVPTSYRATPHLRRTHLDQPSRRCVLRQDPMAEATGGRNLIMIVSSTLHQYDFCAFDHCEDARPPSGACGHRAETDDEHQRFQLDPHSGRACVPVGTAGMGVADRSRPGERARHDPRPVPTPPARAASAGRSIRPVSVTRRGRRVRAAPRRHSPVSTIRR